VKKLEFEKLADEVIKILGEDWNLSYDRGGSIGRRYARNDEIGTPYCVTIDGDSVKNKDVTIRDRDTTKQIRVKISDLKKVMRNLIDGDLEFEKAGKII
jgi:glycyl-tRNA synthetase